MTRDAVQQWLSSGVRWSWQSTHHRIVALGLLMLGVGYLPFRLVDALVRSLRGSSAILMLILVAFGFYQIWQRRKLLSQYRASEEDQGLGHCLILGSAILFPFFWSSPWVQTLNCWFILIGIACSTWGIRFFKTCLFPALLIALGLVPNPGILARLFWDTFTPPLMLEQFTAWVGLLALRAIGQPAELQGLIITLPGGAVEVSWGCTGFNMAMIVAVTGLILGLFFKQSRRRIALLIAIGIALALLFNVPRMVLLAMAMAYWGKESFTFWHDGWGAQIFSFTLLTVYYYAVMPLMKTKPTQAGA